MRFSIVSLTILLLSTLPSARANYLQTIINSNGFDRVNSLSNPVFVGTTDTHTGITSVVDAAGNVISVAGGYADSIAEATYGTLRAQGKSYEPLGGLGDTSSAANAIAVDSLLVVDNTLNFGDPVTLVFTLAVDPASAITPDPLGLGGPYPCASTCVDVEYTLFIDGGAETLSYSWNSATHSPNFQTVNVNTSVGATVGFSYQLAISTFTIDRSGYNVYDADFLDTTHLYIAPQTGTTTLQTDSGFGYVAPSDTVPEPASFVLVLLGACLAGVGLIRNRA